MKWVWRIIVILLLVILLGANDNSEPEAFIRWSDDNRYVQKAKWEIHSLQTKIQDLPASIEVYIKQMIQNFEPEGNGEAV